MLAARLQSLDIGAVVLLARLWLKSRRHISPGAGVIDRHWPAVESVRFITADVNLAGLVQSLDDSVNASFGYVGNLHDLQGSTWH